MLDLRFRRQLHPVISHDRLKTVFRIDPTIQQSVYPTPLPDLDLARKTSGLLRSEFEYSVSIPASSCESQSGTITTKCRLGVSGLKTVAANPPDTASPRQPFILFAYFLHNQTPRFIAVIHDGVRTLEPGTDFAGFPTVKAAITQKPPLLTIAADIDPTSNTATCRHIIIDGATMPITEHTTNRALNYAEHLIKNLDNPLPSRPAEPRRPVPSLHTPSR